MTGRDDDGFDGDALDGVAGDGDAPDGVAGDGGGAGSDGERFGRAAVLCLVAVAAGAAIGVVGGGFRWCLQQADRLRTDVVEWAHGAPGPAVLVPIAAAALGAMLAALIVKAVPLAAGSGIQHVEAVSRGDARPPLLTLLPAKFVGGVLSIGSGLVLGREGPTVHMGAAIGAEAARQARFTDDEVRTMQTALGGAGLAVAFNAPISGVLFALEEVSRSVRVQLVLATLFAAATAVGCMRLLLGNEPDFAVATPAAPALAWLPLFAVFGLLTGLLGAVYNRTVLWFLDRVGGFRRVSTLTKAAVIGGVVGAVGLGDPLAVGGGDALTAAILAGTELAVPVVVGYLLVRMVLGPLSYAAVVPGGLFAPLLAVGALWSVLFAAAVDVVAPGVGSALAVPLALVGMAAFFGATVRAPLTGVVVVMEMAATSEVGIAMMVATAAAVLSAQLSGSPPIYDSLRERMSPPPG